MPPKKKGGGNKSEEKKRLEEEKAKDAVLMMFQQLDQDKINALTNRMDEAVKERMELQERLDESEAKTNEFVNYFQLEIEKKDALITKQREQIVEAAKTLEAVTEQLTTKYETRIESMQEDRARVEAGLRNRLTVLEQELQKLDAFRESKRQMEEQIAKLESESVEREARHQAEQMDQERRFLMDKSKVQKGFDLKLANLRAEEEARLEANRDEETKRIIHENSRLKDELRFQQETTDELNADRRRASELNKKLARELSLFEDKELEYARQGKAKTKQIHHLETKLDEVEGVLSETRKRLNAGAGVKEAALQRQLDEHADDTHSLRGILQLKNKELATLRQHAATILEQRTEVETFFIEALEQCKSAILEERGKAYRDSLAEYRTAVKAATQCGQSKSLAGHSGQAFGFSAPPTAQPGGGGPEGGTTQSFPRMFPRIRPAHATRGVVSGRMPGQALALSLDGEPLRPPSKLPLGPPQSKIHLNELNWEDRERVLKILFAKINAVQMKVKRMPENSMTR